MGDRIPIKALLEQVSSEIDLREEKEKVRKRAQHLAELREQVQKGASLLAEWGNPASRELTMLSTLCSDLPARIDLSVEADVWTFPVAFVLVQEGEYKLCFPDNLLLERGELTIEQLEERVAVAEEAAESLKKSSGGQLPVPRPNPFPQRQFANEMQRGNTIKVSFLEREHAPPTRMASKNLGFWLVLAMGNRKGTAEEILAFSSVVRSKTDASEEYLLEISET